MAGPLLLQFRGNGSSPANTKEAFVGRSTCGRMVKPLPNSRVSACFPVLSGFEESKHLESLIIWFSYYVGKLLPPRLCDSPLQRAILVTGTQTMTEFSHTVE